MEKEIMVNGPDDSDAKKINNNIKIQFDRSLYNRATIVLNP